MICPKTGLISESCSAANAIDFWRAAARFILGAGFLPLAAGFAAVFFAPLMRFSRMMWPTAVFDAGTV